MQTECPHCGQIYPDIDTTQLNQEVQCTACQNVFTVRPYHPAQSAPAKSPAGKVPPSYGNASGAGAKPRKRYRATILAAALDIIGAVGFIGGCALTVMDGIVPGISAIAGGLLIAAAGSGLRLLTQISNQLDERN